jgi:nucleoside-diphosphate-sugar epimerase
LPELNGKRILFAGATSSVGEPVAKALARGNEVIAVARFSNPKARRRLEGAGVRCVTFDLGTTAGEVADLPEHVDFVANFAVAQTSDWDLAIAANAEGVGLLMERYRSATAYLHCSSTAVYQPAGPLPRRETDPLGDNHRGIMETYSITKIAAEAVARTMSRALELPTTIARLNVPYGDRVGFPYFHFEMMRAGASIELHPDRPNLYSPIHVDDIIAMIPGLLAAATVPATIVNWGGTDVVGIEEWCAYMTELTGIGASFVENPAMIGSVVPDLTRLHSLVEPAAVNWQDGLRRMIGERHADLLTVAQG